MKAFDRLHPALQHHIVNSLGWRDLRPVQSMSIDSYLDGSNLVVLAPTAGGKTEAAFFPVISQMLEESWEGVSVLYVSPIKALLNNQHERLEGYFRLVGRNAALWHGDTTQGERRKILTEHPDCLLITPESIEALLVSKKVDNTAFFKNVRAIVIDELHAFAGDDRGWHLLSVFSRISKIAGRDIQRLGLSATVGNPREMLTWLSSGSERSQNVVWPKGTDDREPDVKLDYVGSLANAAHIISTLHAGEKRLVFVDSRSRVEQLAVLLRQNQIDTFVSHSSLGVDERRQAEEAFSQRQNCVIVSTSSLELGLDVGDLDRVIQIDAPGTVSSFLQRMGRTGRRAGALRNCLFLATSDEGLLRGAAIIDLWKQGYVEPVEAPQRPFHILAQQLMALVLQERGGIGRSQWFDWVQSVTAYSDMNPDDVAKLVNFMVEKGILWDDHGILGFAPEGEATFGRKNFLELLSVFTSPPLFKVMSGQKELGFVHESTFFKSDDGPAILALAGRSWKTKHLDWNRRIAHVEATDQSGKSRWMGEGQALRYEVCQAIKKILTSDDSHPTWSRRAQTQIEEIRQEFPWADSDSTCVVQHSNGDVYWWNFAGGIANKMFADSVHVDFEPVANNLSIRFRNASKVEPVVEQLNELAADQVFILPDDDAIANLKFSDCLPHELGLGTFAARYSDSAAITKTLNEPRRVVVQQVE